MQALRATTLELQRFPLITQSMVEYAGPQCFPQVTERSRREANSQASTSQNAVRAGQEREAVGGFCGSWRRCDDCRKWRYLSESAASVFDSEACLRACHGTADWAAWLKAAPERYECFVGRNDRMKAAHEFGDGADSEPELQVERAEADLAISGGGVEEAASVCSASSSLSGSLSAGALSTAEPELADVLKKLSGRGGGLRSDEKEFLDKAKVSAAKNVGEPHLLTGRCPGTVVAPNRVAFRCSMLTRRVAEYGAPHASCCRMDCKEEDDFQALLRGGAGEALFHFSEGDSVLLLAASLSDPPVAGETFSRTAVVRSVKLANLDADVQQAKGGDMQ